MDGRRTHPRRTFAASSAHRGWGVALVVFGGLAVVTSPGQFGQADSSFGEEIGTFVFSIVLGIAFAVWGVYLLRGQGPTTKAIQERLAIAPSASGAVRIPPPSSRAPAVVVNVEAPDAAGAAQVNALANPDTAKALQNLQNLLYTQTITDAEFQAAKDRLLGRS